MGPLSVAICAGAAAAKARLAQASAVCRRRWIMVSLWEEEKRSGREALARDLVGEVRERCLEQLGQRVDLGLADGERRRDHLEVAVGAEVGAPVVERDAVLQPMLGEPRRRVE